MRRVHLRGPECGVPDGFAIGKQIVRAAHTGGLSISDGGVHVAEHKPLRISDVARMVGRSPSSLRELERDGVIPAAQRDRAGQRRYSSKDALVITEALVTTGNSKT
jgi:hypothetical protein